MECGVGACGLRAGLACLELAIWEGRVRSPKSYRTPETVRSEEGKDRRKETTRNAGFPLR